MAQASVFSKMNSRSVVDWVVGQIIQAIIDGQLKPGDKLPVESQLVEQMGVGRNSIREAIKILTAYGIVELRRADGTYICDGFNAKLVNPMVYGLILGDSIKDMLALRHIIEAGSLRLAIENATENDIEVIRADVERQFALIEEPGLTPERLLELDLRFHEDICLASHNALLLKIMEMINRIMYKTRLETITHLINTNQVEVYLLNAHNLILDVLVARSADQVEYAVENSHVKWQDIVGEIDN